MRAIHFSAGESRRQVLSSAARAVLCGIAAGVVAGALDLRQSYDAVEKSSDVALIALQAFARLTAVGGALALAAYLAAGLGRDVARRFEKSERTLVPAVLAGLAAPGLVYISIRLFQGGLTSRLPARSVLTVATALVAIAAVYVLVRLAVWAIARADGPVSRALPAFACAGLAVAAALALRWCDAHMYKRLYLYLHGALAVATIAGFGLAFRLAVFRKKPGKKTRAVALVAVGATALALGFAVHFFDGRQTVKAALYERTATVANVLLLSSSERGDGGKRAPSASARRERYERERRERAAADGTLPAYPGAHLVLITVDALRADRLGVYGNTARALSPRLDAFAREAVVFERAYATAPHSSYSISALHTSRYVHDEAILGKDVAHPTVADVLKGAGYGTFGFYTQGIFFTEGDNVGYYRKTRFGFENARHGAPRPKQLTDDIIAEVDRQVAAGEPALFLWAHYFNVHEPYVSKQFGEAPRDRYDGEIVEADREIGRLIDYLRGKLARDIVIVVAADHGEEFEDHGGHYHGSTLFDEQTRVPFIVLAPGAEGKRISHPISLLDFGPTALALLGRAPAAGMAGQDLRPAIFGGDGAHVPRPVFATVMREHMALVWPWKLVADPSRGLFSLYDLSADPKERTNRYDERRDVAERLLDETRLWLDDFSRGEDPATAALALGRMHDTRAVPGLLALSEDGTADLGARVEALSLIGEMRAWNGIERLEGLLADKSPEVALGAALALAAMKIDLGRELLRSALYEDDPKVRDRAALALGGLGDTAAVPALIEALGRDDLKTRENAIRMLGDLQDPAAVEPLIETVPEERTRYLSVLALGQIGDPRAYGTLMDILDYDTHTDVRGYAVVGLGWLGLEKAVPRLLRVLAEEPEIKWTSEALVRLGAVGKKPLFGTDAVEGDKALVSGFDTCATKPLVISDEFLERTKCKSRGPSATLSFFADAPRGATIVVRARHLLAAGGDEAKLAIRVDGAEVASVPLTGTEMREIRADVGPGVFFAGQHAVELRLGTSGAFELDHLLVLAKGETP